MFNWKLDFLSDSITKSNQNNTAAPFKPLMPTTTTGVSAKENTVTAPKLSSFSFNVDQYDHLKKTAEGLLDQQKSTESKLANNVRKF